MDVTDEVTRLFSTSTVQDIEKGLKIRGLANYIRQKKRAGWSDGRIGMSLGVSGGFIGQRTRALGVSLYQRAELGWSLIPEEESEPTADLKVVHRRAG
jgi:hypothetical protein